MRRILRWLFRRVIMPFVVAPLATIHSGIRSFFALIRSSPLSYLCIGVAIGWFLGPLVTTTLSRAPDRFMSLLIVLTACVIAVTFLLGYLFALVRSHYASSIQIAAVNVKQAIWAAIVGFIVTTLMPILVAYAVEGKPTLSTVYLSITLGLLGGICAFWAFLGLDIRGYLDYRFDHMVTHSALWTDEGVFEKTLELLRGLGQSNRRWIFGKFISAKLTEDFRPIGNLTLAINRFSVTGYSHLLSNLIAESKDYIHMTCPLEPDEWLDAVFQECDLCKYPTDLTAGHEKKEGKDSKRRDEPPPLHNQHVGRCIVSCDPKIIQFADEVFHLSQSYVREISRQGVIQLVGFEPHDCRLREMGLVDRSMIPRHLIAVGLSGASPQKKMRLISSSVIWGRKNIDPSCRRTFFHIHQLIGDMTLLEYQHNLAEHCRQVYDEIGTREPLRNDEYFDYNILDGILIGYVNRRKQVTRVQEEHGNSSK